MKHINILKSYEKWKAAKAIIACIAIATFICIINFHCVLSLFLIYAFITLVLFFNIKIAENRFFPQWKELQWNSTFSFIIWMLFVVALVIFMPSGTFKPIYIIVYGFQILPCLLKAIKDGWYTKKYHLDKYSKEDFTDEEKYYEIKYGMDKNSKEYKDRIDEIRYSAIENLINANPDIERKIGMHTKESLKQRSF